MQSVKDELQMFIDSQKQKLNADKKELGRAKNIYISPRQNVQNEDVQGERYDYYNSRKEVDGLAIGDYESKQRQLKEERIQDYKRYAAEKEFRRTGKHQHRNEDEDSHRVVPVKTNQREAFVDRQEVTTPDIVDAYAELLRKKRAEERSYRGGFEDAPLISDRKVRFSESQVDHQRQQTFEDEDELFQWAREKAKLTDRQRSAGTERADKSAAAIENERKRAKSVPPNVAAGIFGGGDDFDNMKVKKEKYKQELQLQIKEKEEQKQRDKLRRMGRLSSAEDFPKQNENESKKTFKTESPRTPDNEMVSSRNETKRKSGRSSRQQQQQRSRYDVEDEAMEPYFDDRRYRGQLPYRNMPPYNPMMQMMPSGYEMMDPYYMQRGFRGGMPGGFPGHGGMPGPGGMMFGGNPALINQLQGMQGMQGMQGINLEERAYEKERRQTPKAPRTPDSPRKNNENSMKKKSVSPRDKTSGGIFGQSDEAGDGSGRAAKLAYQRELKQQMQEKQAAKEKDKKERERYEAKIEAEIAKYDPWGKSGAGAPMKDQSGKLVADLRTLHKINDEGKVLSPRSEPMNHDVSDNITSLPEDSPILAALGKLSAETGFPEIPNNEIQTSPRGQLQNNPAQRGAALREIQGQTKTTGQKTEQLEYQESLKQQIEEKKRMKMEQERKEKEEEEKENRRLEEQRLKLERDFLQEQERERKKEEETREQNDQMRKAAEQKRQEAQKFLQEVKEDRVERVQKSSSELDSVTTRFKEDIPVSLPEFRNQIVENRSKSPPIPTIAKKQQVQTTSVYTTQLRQDHVERVESRGEAKQYHDGYTEQNRQRHTIKSRAEETNDEDMRYLNSIREQLYQRTKRNSAQGNNESRVGASTEAHIIKQLAALRRQLSTEEQKVQNELEKNMGKYEETKTRNAPRRAKATNMEIFEKARIRKGSFSKKPAPRVADDFTKLTDSSSVLDFKSKFPTKPVTSSDLDLQQREFIRLQEQKLQALRQAISDTSNHLLLDIDNEKPRTAKHRKASKQSLLDSESKFINFGDQTSLDEQDSETQSRQSSARSRRREQEENKNKNLAKPKSPGGYSVGSMTSQAIEDLAAKNEARLRGLQSGRSRNDKETEDSEDVIDQYMRDSLQGNERSATRNSERSLPSTSKR